MMMEILKILCLCQIRWKHKKVFLKLLIKNKLLMIQKIKIELYMIKFKKKKENIW